MLLLLSEAGGDEPTLFSHSHVAPPQGGTL